LPLTVRLRYNIADPLCAFQYLLLAHCRWGLWLSDFLGQYCRFLRGSPGSSGTSEGRRTSWMVDSVGHRLSLIISIANPCTERFSDETIGKTWRWTLSPKCPSALLLPRDMRWRTLCLTPTSYFIFASVLLR
jgi:hypothetical protein